MTNVIAVDSLTKKFGDFVAVDNISFSVPQGVCFGLLGPNGAGKTTTIEMLEGILKPSSGTIELFGQKAVKDLYRRVGIQFQNTALQDYLTVRETLKLFAAFYEKSLPLDTLIELCSLTDFLNKDARKISGGQKQRMLLALALINDPDLIFLDEPTTGLDPQARRNFWELITGIKNQGKSIVLTTHYMDEAEVLCDEIAVMDKGVIIERGSPSSLLLSHFNGAVIHLPSKNIDGKILPVPFIKVGDQIEIVTDAIDSTVQQLLSTNISLDGLQIKRPNLEDLFLKLTGHALRG